MPGGQAIDKSVATSTLPFAGTIVLSALLSVHLIQKYKGDKAAPVHKGLLTSTNHSLPTLDFPAWVSEPCRKVSERGDAPGPMSYALTTGWLEATLSLLSWRVVQLSMKRSYICQ